MADAQAVIINVLIVKNNKKEIAINNKIQRVHSLESFRKIHIAHGRKPPWDGKRMVWDGGQFYQECLPHPPGGWICLNVEAWWGRENCLVL